MLCYFEQLFAYMCHFNLKTLYYNEVRHVFESVSLLQCLQTDVFATSKTTCNNYYLKIELQCENTEPYYPTRYQALHGFHPLISIRSEENKSFMQYIIDAATIKEPDCGFYKMHNDSHYNCLYWLAQLQISSESSRVDITISSNHVGIDVTAKRYILYVNHPFNSQLYQSDASVCGTVNSLLSNSTWYHITKSSNTWFFHVGNGLLLASQNEFETAYMLKLKLNWLRDYTVICPNAEFEIFDAVLLSDSTIIATKYGVFEMKISTNETVLVLKECIGELKAEVERQSLITIAISQNRKFIYWKHAIGNFSEIVNNHNEDILTWFGNYTTVQSDCEILDSVITFGHVYLLLGCSSEKYIIKMTVSNGGVSFNKMQTVSDVTHLVVSNSGAYAFKNTHGKYNWANEVREMMIEQDPSWIDVGMIFSVDDELQLEAYRNLFGISSGSGDIFWQHLRGLPGCAYMGSCLAEISHVKFQRHCPFREIVVSATNLQYYQRVEKRLNYRVNTVVYPSINDIHIIQNDLHSVRFDTEQHAMLSPEDTSSIDAIWLGLNECFEMTLDVQVYLHNVFSIKGSENEYPLDLKAIVLTHHVLHQYHLNVQVLKHIYYTTGMVRFLVRLCCKGHLRSHVQPGIIQHLNSIQFQVFPTPIDCFGHVKTFHSILLRQGCPARKRISIDFQKSKGQHQHFCEEENCFHFDKTFQPVFILHDEATGVQSIYNGSYQVTIVGGGPHESPLQLYNAEQIQEYNLRPGGTLIWVWSSSQKSGQWLCGMSSPCAGIKPVFPKTPEYHFLLQFSVQESVESNCDYNFHFTLKLHGIPPDGIYPSLFIVLVTIAIISLVICSIFFLQVKYPDFFPSVKHYLVEKKNQMMAWFKRKRNKVGATTSDVLHSKVLNWIHKNDKHLTENVDENLQENGLAGVGGADGEISSHGLRTL